MSGFPFCLSLWPCSEMQHSRLGLTLPAHTLPPPANFLIPVGLKPLTSLSPEQGDLVGEHTMQGCLEEPQSH